MVVDQETQQFNGFVRHCLERLDDGCRRDIAIAGDQGAIVAGDGNMLLPFEVAVADGLIKPCLLPK
jgi:hypothetical protein